MKYQRIIHSFESVRKRSLADVICYCKMTSVVALDSVMLFSCLKDVTFKSFGIRISPLLESANINPQTIEKHFTPNIPAWCMKPPEILFDLHSGKKSESNPHILKDDFRKMQSRYKNYQQIYTDGSKEDSKVGCAVISDNHSNMQRIPDDSSIFTAEAKANDLALDFISTCDANNNLLYFLTRSLY